LSFLDAHDLYFEQENDIEFLTKNTDQEITGAVHRRINAIFGDSRADNYYYKPQKITDETLMDVSFILKFRNRFFSYWLI